MIINTYSFGMHCVVGERGQVTIPKSAREALALRPGMQLEVAVEDGAVILRRPSIDGALVAWEGSAEIAYGTTDEFVKALRDES